MWQNELGIYIRFGDYTWLVSVWRYRISSYLQESGCFQSLWLPKSSCLCCRYKSHGCVPKILRTDTSKVVLSPGFHTWLLEKWNATVQRSLPYAHWQNAVERDVQSIVRGISCLLHAQRWLRADSWHLALSHFIELRNRTPRAHSPQSPIQLLTGEVCDWSTTNRFAFGDLLAVGTGNLPPDGRDWQFDTNNQLAIYVGNPPATKRGCFVYYPSSRQVLERLHCWRIDMSDAQFVNFFEKRVRIRDSALPYRDILHAMHDFRLVIVPEATAPSILLEEIPLDPDLVIDSADIADALDDPNMISTELCTSCPHLLSPRRIPSSRLST